MSINTPLVPWTIHIDELTTNARVGIYEHEREPQPVRVDLQIKARLPVAPESLAECMDYEPVCRWIAEQWPLQPHTPLLETKLIELLGFVFRHDERIVWVEARISKLAAFRAVKGVGVQLAMGRETWAASLQQDECFAEEYA